MSLSATYFGSSGWLIQFGDFNVIIDPWLTGKLSFAPGSWLIEGNLPEEIAAPSKLDLLILTQGLADHAHPETLQKLPKNLTVLGPASAEKLIEDLGFESFISLKPGMHTVIEGLEIEATAGAPVPQIENGYLLKHSLGSLYLEPHGFLDKRISPRLLDAVITPVVNVTLPLAGAFVKGKQVLPELIDLFQPKTILASTTGGNAEFSGLLGNLMRMEGSVEEAKKLINENTTLINPTPGKRYHLKTHKKDHEKVESSNND